MESTNQNKLKIVKFLSQGIGYRSYKTLGTSVVYSPMFPPYPDYVESNSINIMVSWYRKERWKRQSIVGRKGHDPTVSLQCSQFCPNLKYSITIYKDVQAIWWEGELGKSKWGLIECRLFLFYFEGVKVWSGLTPLKSFEVYDNISKA